MKKKIIKTAIIIACVLIAAALVLGVVYNVMKNQNRLSDEEAEKIVTELVVNSQKVNYFIWGNGPKAAEGQDGILSTVTGAQYRRVADDSMYKSVEELKTAILNVYSADFYEKSIKYGCFEGSEGATEDAAEIRPRYIDNDDGVLCTDITNEGFALSTRINCTGAKVVSANFDKLDVEVEATVGDEETTLILTLVLQDEGWRLDTPTY